MADYVKDLGSTMAWRRRDAERLVDTLQLETEVLQDVLRWKSNNAVPPSDILDLAVHIGLKFDLRKTQEASSAELDAFIEQYRRTQPEEPSDEQRHEARAAHGPGVELVNVISGRRFTI